MADMWLHRDGNHAMTTSQALSFAERSLARAQFVLLLSHGQALSGDEAYEGDEEYEFQNQ